MLPRVARMGEGGPRSQSLHLLAASLLPLGRLDQSWVRRRRYKGMLKVTLPCNCSYLLQAVPVLLIQCRVCKMLDLIGTKYRSLEVGRLELGRLFIDGTSFAQIEIFFEKQWMTNFCCAGKPPIDLSRRGSAAQPSLSLAAGGSGLLGSARTEEQFTDEYDPAKPNEYENVRKDKERVREEAQQEADRQEELRLLQVRACRCDAYRCEIGIRLCC